MVWIQKVGSLANLLLFQNHFPTRVEVPDSCSDFKICSYVELKILFKLNFWKNAEEIIIKAEDLFFMKLPQNHS